MPSFTYKAVDADGASVSGQLQALDEVSALDVLASRQLTPVQLKQGGHDGPWWNREFSLSGAQAPVPLAELERFFSTFAALMQAKLPLPRALQFCAEQAKVRQMRSSLSAISDGIANGQSLAEAVRQHPNSFPSRFATLLSLGEKSNQLEEISIRAAAVIRAETAAVRNLRGAMIYPTILMIMSVLVLSLVVFFLAPTLIPVFAASGAEPPAILANMAGLRDVLVRFWVPLVITLGMTLVLVFVFAKPIKAMIARLAMRLPLSGPYIKQRESLKFCQSLSLLLASGARLNTALSDTAKGTRHPAYRALIATAENRVVAGGTLSEVIGTSPLMDEMARALIVAGEESDQLQKMLNTASDALDAQSRETLDRAIRLLTPLLTLIIGLGVGMIILSTITAILDLNDIAF